MPIFEYRCEKCGKDFEKIHLTRESAVAVACPSCESEKVQKKFSRFGMSGVTHKSDEFSDLGGGDDDFGGDGGGGDDLGDGSGDDGMEASGPGCGRCGAPQSCDFD